MRISLKRSTKQALLVVSIFVVIVIFAKLSTYESEVKEEILNHEDDFQKDGKLEKRHLPLKDSDEHDEINKINLVEKHKKDIADDYEINYVAENDSEHDNNINGNVAPLAPAKKEEKDQPGEGGKPVIVDPKKLSEEEQAKYKKGWDNNAFNEYVSNMISVDRKIKDVRDKECLNYKYSPTLPATSVIICFHNEAWTILLRSVHSVINRSPPELIKEIILVDDCSTMDHLKEQLEEYMSKLNIVKIVRAKKREGLIRARLLGASAASGEVLTFLDSHIECTEGWLPPLLDPIAQSMSNVTVPVIDVIDAKTLAYGSVSAKDMQVGGFSWDLIYRWHAIPKRDKIGRNDTDPVNTPTMAGGLFSISRKYFEYLGSYDPGFDIWGGENLELSFKIWMCGGIMKMIPCSHVGHIFRKRSPYTWDSKINVLKKNLVRLAEVWMDDYKQFYYSKIHNNLENYGDVSSRKLLREKLQCKSFDWYIKNIYPDQFLPSEALYSGEIKNTITNMCVDANLGNSKSKKEIIAYQCHNQGGNQAWLMTKTGEIRQDDNCIDFNSQKIITYPCHSQLGNQYWQYTKESHIKHMLHNLCLEVRSSDRKLIASPCSTSPNQIWLFKRNTVTIKNH